MKNTDQTNISGKSPRSPIVVILGHVDHGKTTLLDTIRKSNIASREAGGITQKIGASVVELENGKKVTFIDTPGHALFSKMRERGANVADVAVLVVAANEGVKPQTKEALEFILASNIPYLIAATKIDLPGASVDIVKSTILEQGVLLEGFGGDVPLVEVSARQGKGIKELLETISLLAELNNVTGDKDAPLEAHVIETSKEKSGPSASVVVKNGSIKIGDALITENTTCKVRGLFDEKGTSVKVVLPGEPAKVLGFTDLPLVGSRVWMHQEGAIEVENKKDEIVSAKEVEGDLNIILKAQSTGSLEAIINNLPKNVVVLSSGIGDVNESEVFLAKSSGTLIMVFEGKVPTGVKRLAEMEGVKIETFDVIYRLFERVDEILKKGIVEVAGEAEIIASFPYEGKRVAGCRILQGRINKKDTLSLKRGDKIISEVKILSLRKAKSEVEEVKQGEECGIFFAPQLDFILSDMLISLRK